MADKAIWQLAIPKGNNSCPVCGKHLEIRRPCTAMITSPDNKSTRPYTFEALYCPECRLPFADGAIGKKVRDATGCWISIFTPGKKPSVETIRNQMYYQKKKMIPSQRGVKNSFDLVPYDYCVWKLPQIIRGLAADIKSCPKCKVPLSEDFTLIPVSSERKAKVPGRVCRRCKTLYVADVSPISRIMRDNPLTKGFFLNGKELWNASQVEREQQLAAMRRRAAQEREAQEQALTERRREKLRSIPDAVVMVCISLSGQNLEEHIITNKGAEQNNIHTYTSLLGRELLSAAFANERASKGMIDGVSFVVVSVVFKEPFRKILPETMKPIDLTIRTGGGYYSAVKNKRSEIVDLLLYSPLSQRYEIIRATHENENGCCYTDIGLFRQFVREYGNPKTLLSFEHPKREIVNSFDFRTESALMGYGYSVSKASGLTVTERQELLAEVVDLGILEVRKILDLLDFFCRLHSSEKDYSARQKWMEDRRFIESYKVNPSRFMIAQVAEKKGV